MFDEKYATPSIHEQVFCICRIFDLRGFEPLPFIFDGYLDAFIVDFEITDDFLFLVQNISMLNGIRYGLGEQQNNPVLKIIVIEKWRQERFRFLNNPVQVFKLAGAHKVQMSFCFFRNLNHLLTAFTRHRFTFL